MKYSVYDLIFANLSHITVLRFVSSSLGIIELLSGKILIFL